MKIGRKTVLWSGTIRTLFLLFATSSGFVEAQLVVPLNPEDVGEGRLILSRGVSEAHGDCPIAAFQFSLDSGEDAQWTQDSRTAWDGGDVIPEIRRAVRKARAELEGPPFDLCVGVAARPTDPTLARMGGVGGGAFPPAAILLVVAPTLNQGWLDRLSVTIAHEYHHLAIARPAGNGLDVLIREGRADYFAAQLYPDLVQPSARALDRVQIAPAWEKIRANLDINPRSFLRTYMFGGPHFGGEVPVWAGYTLGYCLVRAYAADHPGMSASELDRVAVGDFVTDQVQC